MNINYHHHHHHHQYTHTCIMFVVFVSLHACTYAYASLPIITGIVRDFSGSYTDYLDYRREKVATSDTNSVSTTTATKATTTRKSDDNGRSKGQSQAIEKSKSSSSGASSSLPKMNRDERKEYNKIDRDISKLSAAIKEVDAKINDPANISLGYSALAGWTKEVQQLQEKLEEKELLWMEYHEKFDIA